MKTLQEIKAEKEQRVNNWITDCGMFFAFSNEQFAENKTVLAEGDKYVPLGAGAYMAKSKVSEYLKGSDAIDKWYKAAIRNNKKRKENIIYELCNHEAFYTGTIEDTLAALGESYTAEEVQTVYWAEHRKQTA